MRIITSEFLAIETNRCHMGREFQNWYFLWILHPFLKKESHITFFSKTSPYINGSIFAKPPKVGTMGSQIPANFFFVILCINCSNFFFGRKSL
jgi:hypothetical protein